MIRRVRRDPRSLLELRRLAYRVPRNEDARLVLVDALYETYPELFPRMIDRAEYWSEQHRREQAVFFLPKRLYGPDKMYGPFVLKERTPLIYFSPTREWEEDVRYPRPTGFNYPNAVLVYRTSTKSRL